MPWKLSYHQDTEIAGVGTATASYTDDDGNLLVTHSGRIDNRDGETINGFIDESLARLKVQLASNSQTDSLIEKMQAVLNERSKR